MPTDLTERLAAKLESVQTPWGFFWESETMQGQTYAELVADYAPTLLPLLLSEPELVAGLPDAVRLSVLTPRERAVMKLGELSIKLDGPLLARTHSLVKSEYRAALAEVKGLTPEVGNA